MVRLLQISGKELGRVLTRLGFSLKSQKGSHVKFVRMINDRQEIVVVPNHKTIRKGTLLGILKQLNLSIEKLKDLM